MEPDLRSLGETLEDSPDIVAAIDDIDDRAHVVIADITRDGSWLAMVETETMSLDAWR